MVHAVHTKVAGRGRFHVDGLKGSLTLKEGLEKRLVGQYGMHHASANTVTGNILVVFDADEEHETVAGHIESLLSELSPRGLENLSVPPAPRPAERAVSFIEKASLPASEVVTALRKKVKNVLSTLHEQPVKKWHMLDGDKVLALVKTDLTMGPSEKEVEHRLGQLWDQQLARIGTPFPLGDFSGSVHVPSHGPAERRRRGFSVDRRPPRCRDHHGRGGGQRGYRVFHGERSGKDDPVPHSGRFIPRPMWSAMVM